MKIKHLLKVKLYDVHTGILPGGEEFSNKYGAFRVGPTKTRFMFTDKQALADAISFLEKNGLKAEHIYSFELEPDEVKDYPAFFLNFESLFDLLVEGRVDLDVMGEREIAKDYQTGHLVVSLRVRKILEGVTRAIQWTSLGMTDGQEWFTMEVTKRLPEPVIIPFPIEVEQNETRPDTYTVMNDGRNVITQASMLTVKRFGLCLADQIKVELKVLKRWPIPIVSSGIVIHALQSAGVKGGPLGKLFPLIPETHPLSK